MNSGSGNASAGYGSSGTTVHYNVGMHQKTCGGNGDQTSQVQKDETHGKRVPEKWPCVGKGDARGTWSNSRISVLRV